MMDSEQQRLAETVKVFLEIIREKKEREMRMTKPKTPTAALPSLLDVLIERHKKAMTKPSNDSYFERYSSSNY